MFSFSVHSWQNRTDTADQKYKRMEVAVEKPKWARPREIHCSLCVSRGSTGGGKHLTHYRNTLWHLYIGCRHTLCTHAAATCFLFSLCSACGCVLHHSNPFIQTLWRTTRHWSVSKPRLIVMTASPHYWKPQGREHRERCRNRGGKREVWKSKEDK